MIEILHIHLKLLLMYETRTVSQLKKDTPHPTQLILIISLELSPMK